MISCNLCCSDRHKKSGLSHIWLTFSCSLNVAQATELFLAKVLLWKDIFCMQASLNTVSKWCPFKVLTLLYPVLIQKNLLQHIRILLQSCFSCFNGNKTTENFPTTGSALKIVMTVWMYPKTRLWFRANNLFKKSPCQAIFYQSHL